MLAFYKTELKKLIMEKSPVLAMTMIRHFAMSNQVILKLQGTVYLNFRLLYGKQNHVCFRHFSVRDTNQ